MLLARLNPAMKSSWLIFQMPDTSLQINKVKFGFEDIVLWMAITTMKKRLQLQWLLEVDSKPEILGNGIRTDISKSSTERRILLKH
jgi:hypothetical protein